MKVRGAKRAVKIARNLFGGEGEGEEEPEEIGGKKIVGANERIEIMAGQAKRIETVAKIDTGAYRSVIAKTIADTLSLKEGERYKMVRSSIGKEERPIITVQLKFGGEITETEAFIADREEMKRDVIIGRKDLKKFLIDPTKNILLGK